MAQAQLKQSTFYPLGKDVFASVKTRGKTVRIDIRQYAARSDVKCTKVHPTRKGIALDQGQLQALFKMKKNICRDYEARVSVLEESPGHSIKTELDSKPLQQRPSGV